MSGLLALGFLSNASAAPITSPYGSAGQKSVHISAGLDPAVLIGGGVGHYMKLGKGASPRRLALEYSARTASLSSFDLSAAAAIRVRDQLGPDLLGGLEVEAKILHNKVHHGVSTNVRASVMPGWYGRHWHAAALGSVQLTTLSVLAHSAAYRELFPDVYNGVVGPGAPFLWGGGVVGARVGSVVVDVSMSMRAAANLRSYKPYYLPYTAMLRAGYTWK